MSDNRYIRIGDIGDVVTGKTPLTNMHANYGDDYMFISPKDLHKHFIIKKSEKMISQKGLDSVEGCIFNNLSILVGCIGWDMGNVGLVNNKCVSNQQINSITNLKKEYNTYYIYYWLKNKKGYLFQIANVTRTPILNKTDFSNIEINIPIKNYQDKITDILVSIDAKIELNNKINAELEAIAKLIYDYWFVQFDFPEANGKPYKSSGGKMVLNKELKRDIPDGWEVKELNECIDLIIDHHGKTPKKLGGDWTTDKNGIIALSAKIIKCGKLVNLEQANKVDQGLYEKWMSIKLTDGDILMTSEAPAGEFYFIHGKTDYCMSQRLFAIRSKQSMTIPSYLYYELSKGHGYSQILGSLSGSTVFGIRQDVLRTIKVVIPNLNLQKRFDQIVRPQLKQIKQMDQQNQKLAELRDWLLPMLMNGQVSVDKKEAKK